MLSAEFCIRCVFLTIFLSTCLSLCDVLSHVARPPLPAAQSCVKSEYVSHERSQIVHTAWALLALLAADWPDRRPLDAAAEFLISRQVLCAPSVQTRAALSRRRALDHVSSAAECMTQILVALQRTISFSLPSKPETFAMFHLPST